MWIKTVCCPRIHFSHTSYNEKRQRYSACYTVSSKWIESFPPFSQAIEIETKTTTKTFGFLTYHLTSGWSDKVLEIYWIFIIDKFFKSTKKSWRWTNNVLHATNYGWRETTGRYTVNVFFVNYGIHKHSRMEENNKKITAATATTENSFILDTKRTQTISMCCVLWIVSCACKHRHSSHFVSG